MSQENQPRPTTMTEWIRLAAAAPPDERVRGRGRRLLDRLGFDRAHQSDDDTHEEER